MPITHTTKTIKPELELEIHFEHTTGSAVGGQDFTRRSGSLRARDPVHGTLYTWDVAIIWSADGGGYNPAAAHMDDRRLTNADWLTFDTSSATGPHQSKNMFTHFLCYKNLRLALEFTLATDADGNFAVTQP